MKRVTAIRYAGEIARRLHSVNGLLATPRTQFDAVRFRRVWVFGSTVKGAAEPNDLDILIDFETAGRNHCWQQVGYDKEYRRRYGMRLPRDSHHAAFIWLTKNMRCVSRHRFMDDCDLAYPRVLIYPRFDLTPDCALPDAGICGPLPEWR